MQIVIEHSTRCPVCGFREVRTDEAVDRGLVFLAECPRCEHRWTSVAPHWEQPAGAGSRWPLGARHASREVVSAA